MLVLLTTLSGWTQSSLNWKIIKSNTAIGDTLIEYTFQKEDLKNLRVYVTTLQQYEQVYFINEKIIERLDTEVVNYQQLVNNKDAVITDQKKIIGMFEEIDAKRVKEIERYKKQAGKWPYWLGGGLLGGVILCLSIK